MRPAEVLWCSRVDDERDDSLRSDQSLVNAESPGDERVPWEAGRLVAHRYEIERRLGGGSMGDVFLAHDRLLKKQVAMKVLHPDLAQSRDTVRRFLREVALAHSVTHRNVVRIYDTGEEDGLPFFTMEHLQGQTLEECLDGRGNATGERLGIKEIREIAFDVLDAVSAAHRVGVVHRDLKPGNVMLTHRGAIVMDFGVAGIEEVPEAIPGNADFRSLVRTEVGTIFGSPAYMAPELWEGAPATVQSDIYAFGVMLYQMLTGRLPYEARTPAAYLQKLNAGHPPPLRSFRRDAPWGLVRLVRRCMATDPEERPPSASAAANMLAPLRSRDRRRVVVFFCVLALLGVALVTMRSTPTWNDYGLPDSVAQADLAAAVRAWDVGDTRAAARSLERLAMQAPASAAVRFWRATMLHELGDEAGRRIACEGPDLQGSPVWVSMSRAACDSPHRIAPELLALLDEPHADPGPELLPVAIEHGLLPRVEAATSADHPARNQAVRVLETLSEPSDSPPMWALPTRREVARADLELALGRVAEARARLERLAESSADSSLVDARLGWLALHTGDLEAASGLARELKAEDPELAIRLQLENGRLDQAWETMSAFEGSPTWAGLRTMWCGYALRFDATTLPRRCADLPPGLIRTLWGVQDRDEPPAADALQAAIVERQRAIELGECEPRSLPSTLTHAPPPFETYLFELEIRAALCPRNPALSDASRARTLVNQLAGFAPDSPWVRLLEAEVDEALGADALAEAKRMAVLERWQHADPALPRVGRLRERVEAAGGRRGLGDPLREPEIARSPGP